jgi:hypothetical protein
VVSLLKSGADPNLKWDGGGAPLVLALDRNPPERQIIVAAMRDHGAATEVKSQDGTTPLLISLARGDDETVKLVLDRKADVKARGWNGRSVLHYAMEKGSPAALELLLAHGADVNSVDNSGETPLALARERVSGLSSAQDKQRTSEMAEVLREHGGVQEVPQLDRIEVSRPSKNYSETIFSRGTNDWNRFSLLELIAVHYRFLSASPERGAGDGYEPSAFFRFATAGRALPFPDLSVIRIRRPTPDAKGWQEQTADIGSLLTSGNCSRDVHLQWGDIVEIPEVDHPLMATWQGLGDLQMANLKQCLTRKVRVIVKGQPSTLSLTPKIQLQTVQGAVSGVASIISLTPFWIKPALRSSDLLLSSSDLAHIKVKRTDPATGQKNQWIVDCSDGKPAPDLWLRDGDIIEVPEKQ